MMPQRTPAARICRDCDGFAAVVITTGSRHANGTRVTLTVGCPACHGTGHSPAARLTRVGK